MNARLRSLLLCALLSAATGLAAETRISLLTFNAWGGGLNEGKPVDATLAVLNAAGADIMGLQETRAESSSCDARVCPPVGPGVAASLAASQGMQFYEQRKENTALWANAILCRFPILRATPNDLGVVLEVGDLRVAVFNIHLTDYPYQPYQLLGIPYGDAAAVDSAEQAERAAAEARGPALHLLLADLASVADTDAQVIFGDFNEPSHRDWTERAAAAGQHPLAVVWPFTRALEDAGFVDALRAVYPDEMARPAFTWTPTTRPDDPSDHHDRIDYIFVRGHGLTVESAAIVGENSPAADIVVTPWPADHRAVRALIRLE